MSTPTSAMITAAAVIIAEVGVDMTRFPTPAHLSSWARFAPGVKESAGRKKGNGSTGHGDPYLGPDPGRGRRWGEPDQHVPGRTLPADRPKTRQEEGSRGGRSFHPGHCLVSPIRSLSRLPRLGSRLL